MTHQRRTLLAATALAAAACAWLQAPCAAAQPQPPKHIDQLIQKLKSQAQWADAWDQLLAIGQPAVRPLQRALNDDDGILAVRAAALLYRMGNRSGLTTLADKLGSDQHDVRALAAAVLRIISERRFGYEPAAPAEQRQAAAEKWRNWVKDELARAPARNKPVVAAVDNDEGMVVLTTGSESGVKVGDVFTLARGDKFVAVVKVLRVLPKLCVARVREGEIKRPIQLGDVAFPFK